MAKSSHKSKHRISNAKSKPYKYLYFLLGLILTVGLVYYATTSTNENSKETISSSLSQSSFSTGLVRANQLTQEVYKYVEAVETKIMTQKEADSLSSPIKTELESLRSQLSKQERAYNDSIRKVMGNVMVDKVMKWRKEKGLIPADDRR